MTIRESGEMYLETIYILSQKSATVRGIDVGAEMGFSKPSVSRALGILKKDGLVETDKQGFIRLTAEGEKRAKIIYERHQLLSQLLMNFASRNTSKKRPQELFRHLQSPASRWMIFAL